MKNSSIVEMITKEIKGSIIRDIFSEFTLLHPSPDCAVQAVALEPNLLN